MTNKILILPGDGIGQEVMIEVEKIIGWFNSNKDFNAEIEYGLVGGASYDADGVAISDATMQLAQKSDAVLFGAVGGSKWDNVDRSKRPEAALLKLRKELDLFANLRPAVVFEALINSAASSSDMILMLFDFRNTSTLVIFSGNLNFFGIPFSIILLV